MLIKNSIRLFHVSVVLSALLVTSGCANLISNLTSGLADDLAYTILNSDDIETVREGVPAYLLMIDSFLRSSPNNADLLLAASNLNGAFSAFTEGDRSILLAQKSLSYAFRAACIENKSLCALESMDFESLKQVVDQLEVRDVEVAFGVGVAWAGLIQANSGDWNAIAQLGKVKYMISRVIELDETYELGAAHLYMGGLETVLPASLGGRPEQGKAHFERAIALADGQYLMTKVVYAEQYAKLVFDKTLHDKLLNEVLSANPKVDGMTLTNTLAQRRAKALLAESDDYF